MDMRSFSLNMEITVMLLGPEITGELSRVHDAYRAVSSELLLGQWTRRPRFARWIDNVCRLTSTLQ